MKNRKAVLVASILSLGALVGCSFPGGPDNIQAKLLSGTADQIKPEIQFSEPDFSGYIIELEDDPIIVKKNKLDKREKDTKKKVDQYAKKLRENNKVVKNRILNRIRNGRAGTTGNVFKKFFTGITGRAVPGKEIEIINEFDVVFNGIVLDISEEEAEDIKSINGVKSVTPNYIVHTTLMDSVPLINADDVWKLDSNGNDCALSGKTCLTGTGVTIGIIDTGVDYTHENLGGSGPIEYDFLSRINKNLSLDFVLQDTLQIYNNKVYFRSEGQIYEHDEGIVRKITNNNDYKYFSFFVFDDSMVSVVHSKSKDALGIIETNLNNYQETVLIPIDNKLMWIFANRANNYLVFDMVINYTTGYYEPGNPDSKPIYNLYVYNFITRSLQKIRSDTAFHVGGVVNNNGRLYYRSIDTGVSFIKVYDLETETHLGDINIGSPITIMDSFGDEILINRFIDNIYELINVNTNERTQLPLSSLGPTSIESSNSEVSPSGTILVTSDPDKLAYFNDRIIVFENQNERDKFSIYDRINNKVVSFLNLSYNFKLLQLEGNKICFSSPEGVYCLDYDPDNDYNMPILFPNNKVIGGYDFVNNANPMDNNGHGTHVAATAAGNGVLKGVAPDAKLYAYKVLDSMGSGFSSNIIKAIDRSIDPNQDGDFSDKLDIISLSLGRLGNPDDPMSKAIDNIVDAGVVAVIAAGNSGPNSKTINSPGTARKAITVGAVDKNDNMAIFSSRGPVIWTDEEGNSRIIIKPDVVAPGVSICAAQWNGYKASNICLDDKHIAISGTSMAAPHVSGAAALLIQKNPDWTPEEIKMALKNTAVDIGEDVNTQGYGRIDILGAVNLQRKPMVAYIETEGITDANEIIDIIGTAKGENFDRYILYYGEGYNPSEWIEITTRNVPVDNGVLYENFNPSLLEIDIYSFRLVVFNSFGDSSEDRNIFKMNILNIQITSDSSDQTNPSISGDRIVWRDERNGNWDIYMYNLSTNEERQITIDSSFQLKPSISKDKIVWQDERNGNADIYMYDLSTNEERQITIDSSGQYDPSISGDRIVWADLRDGRLYDVYMYDLSTNEERQITSNLKGLYRPSISGDRIVGQDNRNGNWDIYMFDLLTNEERQITSDSSGQSDPSISGDRIVWQDNRNGNWDIYMYDLSTNQERQITSDLLDQSSPSISGNKIVWHDWRNGNPDIYMYDLSTNEERQITDDSSNQYEPSISGNKIVWHDWRNGNSDIYMYEIPSEEETFQCSDGLDNDADNLIDAEDPGCWDDSTDPSTYNPSLNDESRADLTYSCIDSDGGQDHFVKGIVNWSNSIGDSGIDIDFCTGNDLTEYYCSFNNQSVNVDISCINSCLDGACINITEASLIIGRHVFYSGSSFDGYDSSINANDDNAIAPDKKALLPGQTADFTSYTSYVKGINGIMIDIQNLKNPLGVSADDFEFRIGNTADPSTWIAAPSPLDLNVRQGAGVRGSDRITIVWADRVIKNQWIKVTVKSTANTGLANPDVHYWGNQIAETGNLPGNTAVNATDITAIINNPTGFRPAGIENHYDLNRDNAVSSVDINVVINNTSGLFSLLLLNLGDSEPSNSSIIGRHVFYSGSSFDGNDPGINAKDDNAIAPDKKALLPGQTADFTSYTSYVKGINGIMIDIQNLKNPLGVSADDFDFRIGNTADPSTWVAAPSPLDVNVRQGAGVKGSDRITIVWADRVIKNQWIKVTVKSTANTGLVNPDVHYWGNQIAETGNLPGNTAVNAADITAIINNPTGFRPAGIENHYDLNRDNAVSSVDINVVINNTSGLFSLLLLTIVDGGT